MSVESEPLVSAEGVGVRRAGRWLLRDVDIAVAAGELVTVIGPNGGGKTTLVKTLLGLISPDEGAVRRRPGLTVGYVPQRLAVEWTLPLSVERLMTLTERRPAAAVAAALAETGAAHLVRRPVQALSGGELQRVLLARALARTPDLLVLDEPVQGVDFAGETDLYALIGDIRRHRGCGVLLVSHDLHVVMARTDRVVCLDGGVQCSGRPRDIAADPALARVFGARAGAHLAVYAHDHEHPHHDDHGDDGRTREHGARGHPDHDHPGHTHAGHTRPVHEHAGRELPRHREANRP